jgi:hypothetical protein
MIERLDDAQSPSLASISRRWPSRRGQQRMATRFDSITWIEPTPRGVQSGIHGDETNGVMADQIDDYEEIARVLVLCMEGEAKGDAERLKEAFSRGRPHVRQGRRNAIRHADHGVLRSRGVGASRYRELSGSGVVGASGWRRRQRGGRRGRLLGHTVVHDFFTLSRNAGRLEDRQQVVRTTGGEPPES